MGVKLCPKCEINFITDDEKYCKVCMRELKREKKAAEPPEMCASCGEHPCEVGEDLCIFCLNERELQDAEAAAALAEDLEEESGELGIDELDVPMNGDDIPDTELRVIHEELGLDDDEEDEDDEMDEEEEQLGEHGMYVERVDD